MRVTQQDMAEILEITARQVRNLTTKGAIAKGKDGLYDVSETIKAYTEFKEGGKASDFDINDHGSMEELESLLKAASSPVQRVQIVKDFWVGKTNRQKFLITEREHIPLEDAKAVLEMILSPLNQYLDDQANHIKNHFPDASSDLIEWVTEENNRWKEGLKNHKWE